MPRLQTLQLILTGSQHGIQGATLMGSTTAELCLGLYILACLNRAIASITSIPTLSLLVC